LMDLRSKSKSPRDALAQSPHNDPPTPPIEGRERSPRRAAFSASLRYRFRLRLDGMFHSPSVPRLAVWCAQLFQAGHHGPTMKATLSAQREQGSGRKPAHQTPNAKTQKFS
jgi:hypothetical protein